MTPYEAIYSRSQYLAELTDSRPELANLFIKILHALYLSLIRTKKDPSKVNLNASINNAGLVLSIKGNGNVSRETMGYARRFHNDYTAIYKAVPKINERFMQIFRFSQEKKSLTAILSRDNEKIVISGEAI